MSSDTSQQHVPELVQHLLVTMWWIVCLSVLQYLTISSLHAGGFNSEEDAARAHDVMAMKCRGADSVTNFSQDDYAPLLPQLQKLTKVCLQTQQLLHAVVPPFFLVQRPLAISNHAKSSCRAVTMQPVFGQPSCCDSMHVVQPFLLQSSPMSCTLHRCNILDAHSGTVLYTCGWLTLYITVLYCFWVQMLPS